MKSNPCNYMGKGGRETIIPQTETVAACSCSVQSICAMSRAVAECWLLSVMLQSSSMQVLTLPYLYGWKYYVLWKHHSKTSHTWQPEHINKWIK